MKQTIELGALLLAQGRLLMIGEEPGGPWRLIGGRLQPDHPDTETAMVEMLAAFGIAVPAIEEDFLETRFFTEGDSRLVYNLYAPTRWTGKPSAPPGVQMKWVDPADLPELPIEEPVRTALLETFGLKQREDADAAIMAALAGALEGARPSEGARGAASLADEFRARVLSPAPGALSSETRALIAVALAAATRGEVEEQIRRALSAGLTEGELGEVLELVSLFAGYPAAVAAANALQRLTCDSSSGEPR